MYWTCECKVGYTYCGDFFTGNSAHEGLMETREMRRMPYPEFEWNGFVDSNMHPSYSGNYQIHPNQQLQYMQPMRGNNLNLQHQMPSASPHWHEMDNPQALHSSHSSWGSSADTRNRHSESSMLVDQMHHQENILLEDYMLAHYRSTIRRVDVCLSPSLLFYLTFSAMQLIVSLEGCYYVHVQVCNISNWN